jgi:uncharacterized protein
MPENNYTPPFLFGNGHLQTLFPGIFRKINSVFYKRERIKTFDKDFLDIDWSTNKHKRLAIISHGLEGNTNRAYVKGMVKAINDNGWDALAWNYRSCSGEPNCLVKSYHNGSTDDLDLVIQHAKQKYPYKEIALVGFSLGGNLTLLYLGRQQPDPIVKKAVAFSAPCDLKSSAEGLAKPANKIYMKRFLVMLHQKIKAKMKILPGLIDDKGFEKIKDFKTFDDRYTAPIHGFKNADDYYKKCSSKPFIRNIRIPTLIINARNDPFLPQACYPVKEAEANKFVTLKIPESGGHVGFVAFNKHNLYWSEKMAVNFL